MSRLCHEAEKPTEMEGGYDANNSWSPQNNSEESGKKANRTGKVVTVQTTKLIKSARILRRIQESWRDLQSLGLFWMLRDPIG